MLEIDIAAWAALAGLVVTMLTSLVTKSRATSTVKALVNLALAALAGVITTIAANTGDLRVAELVFGFVFTYLTSLGAYFGLTSKTPIDATIRSIAPNAGIGSNEATAGDHLRDAA